MNTLQIAFSIDWKLTSEIWRNWSIFLSALFAAGTFIWSVVEKAKENRLNRFSTYLNFEKRLNSDVQFQEFITYLEEENPKLAKSPPLAKYKYLGFLEEVAIAVDNGLMSKKLAFYMFGYYAIKARESSYFNTLSDGSEINWDAVYWRVISRFIKEMKAVEQEQLNKNSSSKIKI